VGALLLAAPNVDVDTPLCRRAHGRRCWRTYGDEAADRGVPGRKGITTLAGHASDEVPAASAGSPPPRRSSGAGEVLTLVSGTLAGVGAVYSTTHSVLVTSIAAGVAIAVAVLVLVFRG